MNVAGEIRESTLGIVATVFDGGSYSVPRPAQVRVNLDTREASMLPRPVAQSGGPSGIESIESCCRVAKGPRGCGCDAAGWRGAPSMNLLGLLLGLAG